jgi:hypothetical protein
VGKGEPFLGRPTIKGETLYFATEELGAHVAEHFDLLGSEDGTIHTVVGRVGNGALQRLDATLGTLPNVRLVIIDPLFKFIRTPDADRYVEMSDVLEESADLAMRWRVTILFVHHSKKRETEEVGDSTLGSLAINGGMFTTIHVKGDASRSIQTIQRYGVNMEPTSFIFDSQIRRYELGTPVSAAREVEAESKRRNRDKESLHLIVDRPEGIEQGDLQEIVGGNTASFIAKLRTLVDTGVIRVEGTGKRGSPFRYFANEIPTEHSNTTSNHTEMAYQLIEARSWAGETITGTSLRRNTTPEL